MDFSYSSDQQNMVESLRHLLAKEAGSAVLRDLWSSPKGRSDTLWQQLSAFGLPGFLVSENYGGIGLKECDGALLLIALGYEAVSEPIVETSFVVAPFLQGLAYENHLAAEILRELTSGHLAAVVSFAPHGPVNHGASADMILLEQEDGWYLLRSDEVQWTPVDSVDRARRLWRAEAPVKGYPLVSGSLARELGEQARLRAEWATSGQLLGLGRRLLDMAVGYAKTREQFGRAIGSFQALKHTLADVHCALEFAQPAFDRAGWYLQQADPKASRQVPLSLLGAMAAAHKAARVSLQVHGAIGYSYEHDLHLYFKRVQCLKEAFGGRKRQLARLATSLELS